MTTRRYYALAVTCSLLAALIAMRVTDWQRSAEARERHAQVDVGASLAFKVLPLSGGAGYTIEPP